MSDHTTLVLLNIRTALPLTLGEKEGLIKDVEIAADNLLATKQNVHISVQVFEKAKK